MIFKKIVGLVAAFAAVAAGAVVCMVALAFAIYAGLRDVVGPTWANAAVAGIIALISLGIALIITREVRPPKTAKDEGQTLAAKLFDFARERPLLSAGAATAAAAAAVVVAIRNPRILGAIVAAAFAPHPPPRH